LAEFVQGGVVEQGEHIGERMKWDASRARLQLTYRRLRKAVTYRFGLAVNFFCQPGGLECRLTVGLTEIEQGAISRNPRWPCGLKDGSSAMAAVLRRRQLLLLRESCW
jgi:hypothetical protein